MKRILLFLFVACAFGAISCSKDDDGKTSSSTADVTIDNQKQTLSDVFWILADPKMPTYLIDSEEEGSSNSLQIKLLSKKVGSYTISTSNKYNSINIDIASSYYECTSGTVTITSSDEKIIKGTFTGKFRYYLGTTEKTKDISGTFTAKFSQEMQDDYKD